MPDIEKRLLGINAKIEAKNRAVQTAFDQQLAREKAEESARQQGAEKWSGDAQLVGKIVERINDTLKPPFLKLAFAPQNHAPSSGMIVRAQFDLKMADGARRSLELKVKNDCKAEYSIEGPFINNNVLHTFSFKKALPENYETLLLDWIEAEI